MDNSQNDFNQAWKNLTSQGEMCNTEPKKDFTPVGLRKNVKETGPLYHGTKADLKIGDCLKPGHSSNYGQRTRANFVYLTAIKEVAALAAELAIGEGRGRVYLVEPLGEIEDDPNVTDQKFPGNPSRSYRTKEPLRIVGEEKDWQSLPPKVLEKMQKRLAETTQLGVEVINE